MTSGRGRKKPWTGAMQNWPLLGALLIALLATACQAPRLRLTGAAELMKAADLRPECDGCRPWKQRALDYIIQLEYELERR
jgi:hypothetical protein